MERPARRGPGSSDGEEPVAIGAGALSGLAARLVFAPSVVPHLWASTSDLVATVAGDLGRAVLQQVAASLIPRG